MTIAFFNLPRAGASLSCLVILGATPWAAPGIAHADSLLVGTRIDAEPFALAIDLSNTSLDLFEVTSAGEVISDLTAVHGESASIGTFRNGGTIAGGIWAGVNLEQGTLGAFSNSGTISGGAYGLRANATSFDSFVNHAAIRGLDAATGTGLSLVGNGPDSLIVGDLENGASGEIIGGQRGVALESAVLATLTNRGLIEGSDIVSGIGLDVLGSSIGAFVNDTGATIRGGGIGVALTSSTIASFINNGTIEGATAIAYSPTVLILDPDVTEVARTGLALINAGAIRSAPDGTAIDFGYGNPSALRDDTLILRTGSVIQGAIRFAGGTDTLRFGEFAGSAELSVYDLEDIEPGDMIFTRHFAEVEGDPDRIVIVAPETIDPAPVGQAATGVVNGIAGLIATQAMSASYSGTLLSPVAAAGGSAVLTALDIGEAERPRLWGDIFGYSSSGPSPAQLSGLAFGADTTFGGALSAGALLSYSQSSARFAAGNHALSSHTGVAGFYGTWHAGTLDVGFSLLGGMQAHQSARSIATPGGTETASGAFSGVFVAPGASLSLPLVTSGATSVALRGSATYVAGLTGGYTETGSSSNLTVGQRTITTLDARLGLDARQSIGIGDVAGEGMVRAGAFTLLNGGGNSVPVTLMGQTVDVPTAHSTTFGVYAGAGAAANLGDTLRLELNADTAARLDGTLSLSLRGGISGTF